MNRAKEFRRLRWLLQVQQILDKEKQRLMARQLSMINVDESSLEFLRNELVRLLEAEVKITELSYSYDFNRSPQISEIKRYVGDMLGYQDF